MSEFVPLATTVITLTEPIDIGITLGGRRLVCEIADAVWTGDRLKAKQLGVATADWACVNNEGVGEIDVRATLKTDDGALIYVHYLGRLIMTGASPICFAAPLFETSDPRYIWLNAIQAVGKGLVADGKLTYEFFEVR
jgi:hypothetical protein